jgi:general secretion pathway protein G
MERRVGFTLIEVLVSVAIIGVLAGVLVPSLSAGRETAQAARCLANLHATGHAMTLYHADNEGRFWPTVRYNHPAAGQRTYFWGTISTPASLPVKRETSWFLRYMGTSSQPLWCPSMAWGQYIPQGGVNERTTEYGYNAWCLDPAFWGRRDAKNRPMPLKRITDLRSPGMLQVLADSGMFWKPGGVSIFQNSTSLDPVTLSWGSNTTPTNHFRHRSLTTNALLADGHAQAFEVAGGKLAQPDALLGFIDGDNNPHYDQ